MEEKMVVKVDESIRNLVEGYDYEATSRRQVISDMLSMNLDTTTDAFKRYQKEMMEFQAKFNQGKAEIEKLYVLPVTNGRKCRWSLDYSTCDLTITFID